MARITITIEGDEQELEGALQRLLSVAHGQDGTSPAEPVAETTEEPAPGWAPEELAAYWDAIRDDARGIVAEVAKRPEGYPFDDLQAALGMGPQNIGGRLSSVGHARRRFPGKPQLVERDYRLRQYRMDPAVAEAVRRLAEGGGE